MSSFLLPLLLFLVILFLLLLSPGLLLALRSVTPRSPSLPLPSEFNSSTLSYPNGSQIAVYFARLDPSSPPSCIVILLHGLRKNRDVLLPRAQLLPSSVGLVLVEARHHGNSSSYPLFTAKSMKDDLRLVCDWVHSQFPEARLVLWGHSMGSAAALGLASEGYPLAGVIAEAAYPSIFPVRKQWAKNKGYPLLVPLLITFLEFIRFTCWKFANPRSFVNRITIPVLLAQTSNDQYISPQQSLTLQEAFPSRLLTLFYIQDLDHNTIYLHPRFSRVLSTFLNSVCF